MKALTYIGRGRLALLDKPEPKLQNPRDAIVRVTLGCRIDGGQAE